MSDGLEMHVARRSNEQQQSSLNLIDVSNLEIAAAQSDTISSYGQMPLEYSTMRLPANAYDMEPSENSQERLVPQAGIVESITFTLGMPVIFSAGVDLMMRNRNFTLTKSTLNFYKNTTASTCKLTGKAVHGLYSKQLRPRSKKAWKAFWEPIKDKNTKC